MCVYVSHLLYSAVLDFGNRLDVSRILLEKAIVEMGNPNC